MLASISLSLFLYRDGLAPFRPTVRLSLSLFLSLSPSASSISVRERAHTPTYFQFSFFVRLPTSRSSSPFDQGTPIAHFRVLSFSLSLCPPHFTALISLSRPLLCSDTVRVTRTHSPEPPTRPSPKPSFPPVYLRPWPSCVHAYRLSPSIASVYTRALPLLVTSKHGYARARESCGGRCTERECTRRRRVVREKRIGDEGRERGGRKGETERER